MRVALAVLAMASSGCALLDARFAELDRLDAEEARQASIRRNWWVGKPIHHAVSDYGPPTETHPNGPLTLYVWAKSPRVVVRRDAHVRGGRRYASGTEYATAQAQQCRWWLDVNEAGVVVGAHWPNGECE